MLETENIEAAFKRLLLDAGMIFVAPNLIQPCHIIQISQHHEHVMAGVIKESSQFRRGYLARTLDFRLTSAIMLYILYIHVEVAMT